MDVVDDIRQRMQRILGTAHVHPRVVDRWMSMARNDPEPAPFYIMPKLHKRKLFTSRPVTRQHQYMLTPLSKALADRLQTAEDTISEIPKDSKTVAQIPDTFRFNAPGVLITYDVEALYPSIDLFDAIKTLEANVPVLSERDGFWLKVLKLVIYNNYISFDDKIYLQLQGTATGTAFAPAFENLYLYYKFRYILSHDAIQIQLGYIDDGFMIVNTTKDAELIIARLNAVSNLRLTHAISDRWAIFLDLEVYRGRNTRGKTCWTCARTLTYKQIPLPPCDFQSPETYNAGDCERRGYPVPST